MQQSTTHSPLDVATDLSWQEQILIRLDEIVGLLDSIESRLVQWEEGGTGIRCQESACQGYPTPDTGHLDTPNLPSVACHLPSFYQPPSPDAEEPPQ
jgi:hypothetical protein